MFKLFGFVSKLSLLDKYSVIYGDRTNLLPDESAELKALAHSILKRLREKDFSCLVRALEKRGGCETPCIFFQTHERLGKRVVLEPQVVLFRIFRLPQIRSLSELKHIAACSPCHDIDGKVCINPFHYSATISSGLFTVVKSEIFAISDLWQCIGDKISSHLICIRDVFISVCGSVQGCDLFHFFLFRTSRCDFNVISQRYENGKRRKFRYVQWSETELLIWSFVCAYSFQTYPSTSVKDFPFLFAGFISNLTQSSTCRLDSRTLSSQSTGK